MLAIPFAINQDAIDAIHDLSMRHQYHYVVFGFAPGYSSLGLNYKCHREQESNTESIIPTLKQHCSQLSDNTFVLLRLDYRDTPVLPTLMNVNAMKKSKLVLLTVCPSKASRRSKVISSVCSRALQAAILPNVKTIELAPHSIDYNELVDKVKSKF